MTRPFRTEASYKEERITRSMLAPLLRKHGFSEVKDQRTSYGRTESQSLTAVDSRRRRVKYWVRLCWRRDSTNRKQWTYSAAQLRARVKDNDWIGTLREKIRNEKSRGATHLLLVQRVGHVIVHAASIPIDAVVPIWIDQRSESKRLISSGLLGSRTKNHAMNGRSPTIWLRDDRAPSVALLLWKHAGVSDIVKLATGVQRFKSNDILDSLDDLPGMDYSALGGDGGERKRIWVSGVARNVRVRKAVLRRSASVCERIGCGETRAYNGFLDVHHILGAEYGDRVWNCVALCPNCHREAHVDPDASRMNAELLEYAGRFRKARRKTGAAKRIR